MYKPGDRVRQCVCPVTERYDYATVTFVHGNGALDVISDDGVHYGWSERVTELVPTGPNHDC